MEYAGDFLKGVDTTSIAITFYQFAKRTNSTLTPNITGVTQWCELFDDCSITAPRIKIAGDSNPTIYNYCFVDAFRRWYFVRDWTWSDGLWTASLAVDTLATWKQSIWNATEYVTRAASDYDPYVVDALYPTIGEVTTERVNGTNQFGSDIEGGSYILGTVSNFGAGGNFGFGSNVYWNLGAGSFRKLRSALLSDTDYLNISVDEISSSLTKALLNPYQYLISCMFYPFSWPKNTAYDVNSVGVGWWDLSLGDSVASVITSGYDTAAFVQQFNLVKHPQITNRGRWLCLEPYSSYTLFVPPFGEIHLDASLLVDATSVYYKIIVDAYTGQGILTVTTGQPGDDVGSIGSRVVAMRTAQVGVPVSLAQIAYNPVDSLGELTGAAGTTIHGAVQGLAEGLSAGGNFFDMFDSVGNAIGDAISHKTSSAQYKGSCGAVGLYSQAPYLECTFTKVADEDNEHRGRPLCSRRQLGTLSGYVKCADADISFAGTREEMDAVKRHLQNGFYME